MMKSILLSALSCMLFLSLSAQPAQGTWLLGGDVRFQSDVGDNTLDFLAISPRAGYFITDRLALGLGAGFSAGRTAFTDYAGVSVSPFARYYLPLGKSKLSVLFEAGGAFSALRVDAQTFNDWRVHGAAGLSYFLSPEFALEATLGAARVFPDGEAFTETDFNLGFQVFLPRKDKEADTPTNSGALRKRSLLLGAARTLSLNSGNHTFEPTFSYMLSNRVAVGAAITLPINEFRPYLRYFAGSGSESRLRPYVSAGSSLIWKYGEADQLKVTPFVDAGLLYFISPNLALEGALQYQHDLRAVRSAADPGSSVVARVGFQYLLSSQR